MPLSPQPDATSATATSRQSALLDFALSRPAEQRASISGPGLTDWGLLSLRLFAGLALALAHGIGKLPPSPGFIDGVAGMGFAAPWLFAWAAALAESLGGVLLALGLVTRPAAFVILINMLVAGFLMQAGDPFLDRELALLYAGVALLYTLGGPGRLSMDAWLGREAHAAIERAESGAGPTRRGAPGAGR